MLNVFLAIHYFFLFTIYLELLRKSAEHSLSEMVRLLYSRLSQFPLQETKGSVNYKVFLFSIILFVIAYWFKHTDINFFSLYRS